MATETRLFSFDPGPDYSGKSASIQVYCLTNDGTVRVNTTGGATVGAGNLTVTEPIALSGAYVVAIANFDPTWRGVIKIVETTTPLNKGEAFGAIQTGDAFAAAGSVTVGGYAAHQAPALAETAPTWWNAPDNADVGTILTGINTALTNLGTVLTGEASLSANVAAIKAVTDALNTLLEADPNNAGDSRIVAAAFANLLTQLGFGFPVVANPGPSTTSISFQIATGTIPAGHFAGRKAYRPLSAGEALIAGHVIASANLGGLGYDVHTITFADSAPFPAAPAVGDTILISV